MNYISKQAVRDFLDSARTEIVVGENSVFVGTTLYVKARQCMDCKYHSNMTNTCTVWFSNTPRTGYCYRFEGKNDAAR